MWSQVPSLGRSEACPWDQLKLYLDLGSPPQASLARCLESSVLLDGRCSEHQCDAAFSLDEACLHLTPGGGAPLTHSHSA